MSDLRSGVSLPHKGPKGATLAFPTGPAPDAGAVKRDEFLGVERAYSY